MPTDINTIFEIVFCIAIAASVAYLGGRFHQWYRLGTDRDQSFQEGYRHGYRAFFLLAVRDFRPGPGR